MNNGLNLVLSHFKRISVIQWLVLIILFFVGYKLFDKHSDTKFQVLLKSMLLSCFAGILLVTVFSRTENPYPYYNFELLWSYREFFYSHDSGILIENLLNIILFIPLGMLLCAIHWKKIIMELKMATLIGCIFSVIIETLQLVLRRGQFEFDDILHNVLGVIVGFFFVKLLNWGLGYRNDK